MQKGLRLKNLKFFTGMENYEESNAVPEDKMYSVQNARFVNKVVSSKKGYQALGDVGVGGTRIEGIYSYPYFNGTTTTEKLIRFYNSTFATFNESTQVWDTIATAWPNVADSFTDGVVYNNVIYFINPLTGAGNGVAKISNSTFSVIATSPRGTAMESWVERLWAIGDPTAPNAVVASRAALLSAPTNIEDWTTGTILELVGKGGKCTAIRVLNNQLYVWKQDSIYFNTIDRIANGDTQFQELSRTGGAINQKSTIIVENDVWFMTPNLEVRSLGTERNLGENPRTKSLTEIIKRSMNLLDPNQDNPVMSYNNRVIKVQLKTKMSPTNNFTILFDYNTGGWSVDRGQAVNVSTVWKNNLVYGEDSSGQAYTDDSGYTANGAAFVFQADTPFMDDSRPDINKRARYIYFRGQQSYYQPITLRLYRGDYDTYSEYTITSPQAQGIALDAAVNDGQWGSSQQGAAPWGGTPTDTENDIAMYRTEKLISIERRDNMFSLGVKAEINGGKVIVEQLILKLIDDNENYKRSDL